MTGSNLTISEIFKNGESSFVEFKEKDVRVESLAKVLVAFLNFEGGTVYIGVNDEGTITGVDDRDYEEWVMNIFRSSIYPPVIPGYEEALIGDKKVVKVQVNKGQYKPYYVSTSTAIISGWEAHHGSLPSRNWSVCYRNPVSFIMNFHRS